MMETLMNSNKSADIRQVCNDKTEFKALKGAALKSQTWAEILHFGYKNFGPLIFILYDPISIEQLEADINRYFYFLLSSTC